MSPVHTLTELQYSQDRKGPWRLYLYDRNGYHRGGQWFRDKPEYEDEEITTQAAQAKCGLAMSEGREVRITDAGDMLVFHAQSGKVVFGENFWKEIGQ